MTIVRGYLIRIDSISDFLSSKKQTLGNRCLRLEMLIYILFILILNLNLK